MTQESVTTNRGDAAIAERVMILGDLSQLSATERVSYYGAVCRSLGLNPLTKPFDYISLNGKLVLYAKKDATEQLRKLHAISITQLEREATDGVYVVIAHARASDGRTDSSIGAVPIENLKGVDRANAMMKAETKAKRRVTLSISGLGMLDETEIETIPDARPHVENLPSSPELPTWRGNLTALGRRASTFMNQTTPVDLATRISAAQSSARDLLRLKDDPDGEKIAEAARALNAIIVEAEAWQTEAAKAATMKQSEAVAA